MRIFVYGTLKRGASNHVFLKKSKFLGEDRAPGKLYVPKGMPRHFPYAAPAGEGWIKGEVYSVNAETLERLDRLEGHPNFYCRSAVHLESGKVASIYYINSYRELGELDLITDGVWKCMSQT